MDLFLTTPAQIAPLWEKHGLSPIVGDLFAWKDDQDWEDRPRGADIAGILLIEHAGWEEALRIFHGEGVAEVLERYVKDDGSLGDTADIGLAVAGAEALGISLTAFYWLMQGWDWPLKGTEQQFEVPPGANEHIGQAAYKMGVETRMLVESKQPVYVLEE